MTDYLEHYKDEIDGDAVRELRKEPTRIMNSKGNKPYLELIESPQNLPRCNIRKFLMKCLHIYTKDSHNKF